MKDKLKTMVLDASLVHGGEIFLSYYQQGFEEGSESKLMEMIRDEIESYREFDQEKATILEKALREDGLIKALGVAVRFYPSHGEFVGYVIGTLMRLGKYEEGVRILKIAEPFWWDT